MDKHNTTFSDTLMIVIGEVIVSALVILGYVIASAFSYPFTYKVITGVILGSSVTVANFFFLTLSVNRAVDRFIELRGSREMTEEEAEKFTNENSMAIQNAIKTSFIIRTVSMLAAFVLAFVAGVFEPLATVIPLLAYRPIISIGNILRNKNAQNAQPTKNSISEEDNG